MTARLVDLPDADLIAWREQRSAAGSPLPDAPEDEQLQAFEVVVDDVAVGGAVVSWDRVDGPLRCGIRELQTTLPEDATESWAEVVAAFEGLARARGAHRLVTAVPPSVAGVFGAAGFRATVRTLDARIPGVGLPGLHEDRRVSVRPMDRDERVRFVADARVFVRDGMARSGVQSADAPLVAMEDRLSSLVDPAPDEVLMTGTVDGVPVGRVWVTLAEREGGLVVLGNTVDLFPEHRGQGLTKSLLGAMARYAATLGVTDVRLRVYGHHESARRMFVEQELHVADVHLRKDL